jgi:hypothetical protein
VNASFQYTTHKLTANAEVIDSHLSITDGKGKEKEQAMLRIGLMWEGFGNAESRGFGSLLVPPGKMFRSDSVDIPLSAEQKASAQLAGLAPSRRQVR